MIRGLASTDRPQVGHFTDADVVLEFCSREKLAPLAALGTSCPDHFLRTKVRPLVVDLPAYVSGPSEWAHFWVFNSDRGADLGSVWLLLQQTTNHVFTASTINHWSWLVFGVWCAFSDS